MTSLTVDRVGALQGARRLRFAVLSERGSDVLIVVAVIALAAGLVAYLPSAFNVDSWLSLVGGREVWQFGLPHHESLTSLASGVPWVDQQWLSQLVSYAIYLAGGLALLGVVNVFLLVAGVGGALAAARRLGAAPIWVMLVLPGCLWLILPSREVRTQEFVIPLFVALVYLLATDSRKPSRRVFWCLPILVLWANLHGTVTLGALLVGLRGLTMLWDRRQLLASPRSWLRPVILLAGAALAILVTPYGTAIFSYYHTMLLGGAIRHAVTEWQPITTMGIIQIPFYLTVALALWSFGRAPAASTWWDRLALVALAAGSIEVNRNALFFALTALMLMPLSLTAIGSRRTTPRTPVSWRGGLNAALLILSSLVLVVSIAVLFVRPSSRIELSYERLGVLNAVERATSADPSLKVLADVRFADWLLWRDPALRGRIANDARFELLNSQQMTQLQNVFYAIGPNWKRGAAGYRIIVLDRRYQPDAARGFLAEPGRRVLYDDGNQVVILRPR